jgi:hypothetical protein
MKSPQRAPRWSTDWILGMPGHDSVIGGHSVIAGHSVI